MGKRVRQCIDLSFIISLTICWGIYLNEVAYVITLIAAILFVIVSGKIGIEDTVEAKINVQIVKGICLFAICSIVMIVMAINRPKVIVVVILFIPAMYWWYKKVIRSIEQQNRRHINWLERKRLKEIRVLMEKCKQEQIYYRERFEKCSKQIKNVENSFEKESENIDDILQDHAYYVRNIDRVIIRMEETDQWLFDLTTEYELLFPAAIKVLSKELGVEENNAEKMLCQLINGEMEESEEPFMFYFSGKNIVECLRIRTAVVLLLLAVTI